jgi:SAM-dependent methyltransferase
VERFDKYDRVDALLYDHYQRGVQGDVRFYVEQARESGGPVLEIGCGTGRVLLPIAEAGIDVVGLDLSAEMLDAVRAKLTRLPPETQARVQLVHGDMRAFALGRRFPLVTIPYRSFLHLLSVDDQRRALACIHRHVRPGGRLVLNVWDIDAPFLAERLAAGAVARRTWSFANPETGRLTVGWETFRYDATRQILDGDFVFDEYDDEGNVVAKRSVPLTLRWTNRFEMQHLLEGAGFEIEALYGDFEGGTFEHGAEQVWIARAP